MHIFLKVFSETSWFRIMKSLTNLSFLWKCYSLWWLLPGVYELWFLWRSILQNISEYDQKYHNHTLQTGPRHWVEEPHNINSNKTQKRQLKQNNKPSPSSYAVYRISMAYIVCFFKQIRIGYSMFCVGCGIYMRERLPYVDMAAILVMWQDHLNIHFILLYWTWSIWKGFNQPSSSREVRKYWRNSTLSPLLCMLLYF